SCFPKDVTALQRTGAHQGVPLKILAAVDEVNQTQKKRLVQKLVGRLGPDLHGRKFALWGLAFKPNTDDMREAPSLVIIDRLLKGGAPVTAFDPGAGGGGEMAFAGTAMQAPQAADALLIATEWKAFRSPDFDALKASLKSPVIFDG